MNDPPHTPKDRQQLPDPPPSAQRYLVQQSPLASLSAVPGTGVRAPLVPGLSLHSLPPAALRDFNTWNKISQMRGVAPSFVNLAPMAPAPSKENPMALLGAAALQHQQQIQNASILQSLIDQKQQITKYEDEIRRRMMLPPSDPLLQAHLVQNDPGRFLGGLGLMGNLGINLNPSTITAPVAASTTVAHLAPPPDLSLRGDGRALRGGVIEPFPEKLHRLLQESEAAGLSDIISFTANGRAFTIHKPERFFKEIVPQYFRHKRLSSFKRQLNLYGFELISSGPYRGSYYHKLFVKGRPELCITMRRSVTSKTYTAKPREERPDFLRSTSPSPSDTKQDPSKEDAKGDSDVNPNSAPQTDDVNQKNGLQAESYAT